MKATSISIATSKKTHVVRENATKSLNLSHCHNNCSKFSLGHKLKDELYIIFTRDTHMHTYMYWRLCPMYDTLRDP